MLDRRELMKRAGMAALVAGLRHGPIMNGKPRPRGRPGLPNGTSATGSVADVHGPPAEAERRQHAAGHVTAVIAAATDEAAETASSSLRERMYDAFARATQLEWIFWDSAFRLESWPV